MASGWRQYGVRMRQDGVRQASHVCQGRGVGVRSASGCVRMRQEGVRVASGRRQDNLVSGWLTMTSNDAGPESIGGTAGGTTPPHHPNPAPGNTGEPMYPRPPPFPCPLPCCPIAPRPLPPTPWGPAFPCPFPCSPCCPAPFACLPLPASTCSAPLLCYAALLCSACTPLIPVLPVSISNW